MLKFIVVGLIMSILLGAFVAMMFSSFINNKKLRFFVCIVLSLIIGFSVSGFFAIETKIEEIKWNNGKCSCGGEWELFDIERSKHNITTYYYQCENCDNLIEI